MFLSLLYNLHQAYGIMWVCLYTASTLQLIDKFSRKLELSQKLIVARVAEKFSIMYGNR
jgi:hypothetical protein